MCYSTAPSTTNQNATQRIYKGYKVARKSLQAYSIKMQYEIVLKVIGGVHIILAFLKLFLLLKLPKGRWLLRVLVLLRQLNVYSRTHGQKTRQQYKHTCKQRLTLRNSTTIHKNGKQNQARTILRITTIAWARKPPKTELERENQG